MDARDDKEFTERPAKVFLTSRAGRGMHGSARSE
jgi:hypothetical protein